MTHKCQWCPREAAAKVTITPARYQNRLLVQPEEWGWACEEHVRQLQEAKREQRPRRRKVHADQLTVDDFPEVFA